MQWHRMTVGGEETEATAALVFSIAGAHCRRLASDALDAAAAAVSVDTYVLEISASV